MSHAYRNPLSSLLWQAFGVRLAANELYLAVISPGSGDVSVCSRPAPQATSPALLGWQSPSCVVAHGVARNASSLSMSQYERSQSLDGSVGLAVGVPGVAVHIFQYVAWPGVSMYPDHDFCVIAF